MLPVALDYIVPRRAGQICRRFERSIQLLTDHQMRFVARAPNAASPSEGQ
jgi:hypothetical protein